MQFLNEIPTSHSYQSATYSPTLLKAGATTVPKGLIQSQITKSVRKGFRG